MLLIRLKNDKLKNITLRMCWVNWYMWNQYTLKVCWQNVTWRASGSPQKICMQVYSTLVARRTPQQPKQKTKHLYQINPDLRRCRVINKRSWTGFPLSALTQDISAIPYTRRPLSWDEDILGHQFSFLWCENLCGLKGNATLGSHGVGLLGGVVLLE